MNKSVPGFESQAVKTEDQVTGGQEKLEETPTQTHDSSLEEPVPTNEKGVNDSSTSGKSRVNPETFKDPQFVDIIEAVRAQEKAKLYKTIQDKEAEIRKLKDEMVKLENTLKEIEEASLTEEERLKKEVNQLSEELKRLSDSIEAEREAAAKEKREAQLQAYKERRIREIREEGGNLIVKLVKGNSEEEIEGSIKEAQQEYLRILEENKPAISETIYNTPRITNPPLTPGVELTADMIRNMSAEEYAKNRDKIKRLIREGGLS